MFCLGSHKVPWNQTCQLTLGNKKEQKRIIFIFVITPLKFLKAPLFHWPLLPWHIHIKYAVRLSGLPHQRNYPIQTTDQQTFLHAYSVAAMAWCELTFAHQRKSRHLHRIVWWPKKTDTSWRFRESLVCHVEDAIFHLRQRNVTWCLGLWRMFCTSPAEFQKVFWHLLPVPHSIKIFNDGSFCFVEFL